MRKLPVSFISGLAAFVLLLAPFAPVQSVAAEQNVRDDNYGEVREDNYDGDVTSDAYDEEAYEDGYYDGYFYGYNGYDSYSEEELSNKIEGYAEGYRKGYEEGRQDAKANVEEDGYDDGNLEGYWDGFYGEKYNDQFEGDSSTFGKEYDLKYAEAYAKGYKVGYAEGEHEAQVAANIYDAYSIEDTVTGETYDRYSIRGSGVKELLDKDGQVILADTRRVVIDKVAIEQLEKPLQIITPVGTTVSVSKATLLEILKKNDGDTVYIDLGNVTAKYKDALSEAIEFEVYSNGEFAGKDNLLDEPVLVTFQVDKDKVNNWHDLVLRYVDKDGKTTDYKDQIVSVNPETGEVVAKVYHFSTYYIAEVEGSGPFKDGVINSDSTTVTVNGDNGGNGDGQTLPATATNAFNILLAGAALLLAGVVTFAIRRKRAL